MSQGRRARIRWLAFALALSAPTQAEEARAPAIWYRASQQCPSDAEFIDKLASNPVRPRLAQAGDHIDFLVTLIDTGTETTGRLERQTRAGTVAIRELRDASCARVAEGLALSLGLALEPNQAPTVDPAAASSPTPASVPVVAAPAPAPTLHAPSSPAPAAPAPENPPQRTVALGAAAGVLYGLAPRPMGRGQVFVDLDPVWPRLSSLFSARAGALFAAGSGDTRIGSVQQWLLAGYVEGCPWRFGNARLGLRPCLAFELGASAASHGEGTRFGDSALWATPGAGLRATVSLPHRLGLEAGAGVQVPLRRNQVFAGQAPLYRAEIMLFQATVGVSFGLP